MKQLQWIQESLGNRTAESVKAICYSWSYWFILKVFLSADNLVWGNSSPSGKAVWGSRNSLSVVPQMPWLTTAAASSLLSSCQMWIPAWAGKGNTLPRIPLFFFFFSSCAVKKVMKSCWIWKKGFDLHSQVRNELRDCTQCSICHRSWANLPGLEHPRAVWDVSGRCFCSALC